MPIDSSAPVTATILFEGEDGTAVAIPAHQFLQSLSLVSAGIGHWSGTLTLFDEEAYEIENLLLAAGSQRNFRIRFGDDDGKPNSKPEFLLRATNYTPEFTPEGVSIQIEFNGREVVDATEDKKVRSWPENTPVSDIVRDIADDRGWLDNAVIENTIHKTTEPLSTDGNESDVRFIRERLVPIATGEDTQQPFYFYFDPDGKMHFHSEAKMDKQASRRYRFARDAMGEVLSFAPSDTSFYANIRGGGNSLFESPSALAGGKVEVEAEAGSGLTETGGASLTTDESHITKHGPGTHARIHFNVRDPDEFRARVQNFRERVAKARYSASMSVRGTHRVLPFTYVDVDYILPNGTSHYLGGMYLVTAVTHTYDQSGWVTEFEMIRRGVRPSPHATRVTNAQVHEINGDAPDPANTHRSPVNQE